MNDPIVEEIHKIRAEYAAEFDYDVDAMFEDLRRKQSESSHKVVTFVRDNVQKQKPEEKRVA